jgi:hypothetical protein
MAAAAQRSRPPPAGHHREGWQAHHHHVTGQVGNVFKAVGVALPHNLDEQTL